MYTHTHRVEVIDKAAWTGLRFFVLYRSDIHESPGSGIT